MPHDIPDYHGDHWIREERDENGELRHDVARHEAERVRDGFSEYDWWNFDTFIAEIVARAALKFAEEGHCYFEEMGEEGTREYYLDIARPLMRYARDEVATATLEEMQLARTQAVNAMVRFAVHFERWND